MRAEPLPLRAGDRLVTVRPPSEDLRETLAREFRDRIVPYVDAPVSYSMHVSPASESIVLRHGCETLLRTPSFERTIDALRGILRLHETETDPTGVQVDAVALVHEDRTVVVDAGLRSRLVGTEEILDARGASVVPWPAVVLDAATAGVRLGRDSTLPVSTWAWRRDALAPARPQAVEVIRRVNAVVVNREHVGAQVALETVARSVTGARTFAIPLPLPPISALVDELLI